VPKRVRQDEAEEVDASSNEPIEFDILPFSPQQANDVNACLQEIAAKAHAKSGLVINSCWRSVLEAAQRAERAQLLADPERRSRIGQKLRRLARASSPKVPGDIDSETLISVAFGAERLGLIRRQPRTIEGAAYRKVLSGLTREQLRESAVKALVEPLLPILGDKTPLLVGDRGGRPKAANLDDYIEQLLAISQRASGKELGLSRTAIPGKPSGPLLRFIRACLAPESLHRRRRRYSDEAIVSAIRRVRRRE